MAAKRIYVGQTSRNVSLTSAQSCPFRGQEGEEETPCTIGFGNIKNRGHVLVIVKQSHHRHEQALRIPEG